MGVLLAAPCFGEEGDRPSAGSMVYAVTYCTVFSVDLHHTTLQMSGPHSSFFPVPNKPYGFCGR